MTFCHYELNQYGSGPFLFSAHPLKRFIFQEIINICHQVFDQNPQQVYGPRLAEMFRGVIRLSNGLVPLSYRQRKETDLILQMCHHGGKTTTTSISLHFM